MEDRLIKACSENDLVTVRRIMRKPGGVDINYRNNLGESAILMAAKGGYPEIVKVLVEHSCYINNPNGLLVRPLHLAAKGDHLQVIKLLLNAGAIADTKSSDSFRPIDFAEYNTQLRTILSNHAVGVTYEIEEPNEGMPIVPDYALAAVGIQKKKPDKGKKGGKKKGGKKKKKKK